MRKLLTIAAVGVLCSGLGLLRADEKGAKLTLTGDGMCAKCALQEKDTCQNVVIVKKEGAESKTFKISEKTKYATADKKEALVTDIKVGDKVTVWYTEEDGVLTAHRIAPPAAQRKEPAQ